MNALNLEGLGVKVAGLYVSDSVCVGCTVFYPFAVAGLVGWNFFALFLARDGRWAQEINIFIFSFVLRYRREKIWIKGKGVSLH